MEYINRQDDAWMPPISNYHKVEKEAYEVIVESAKDRFEDIMSESESITEKSLKMLGWLAALAGFYVGYLIKEKPTNAVFWLPAPFFAWEAILLLLLIAPKKIKNRGLSPSVSIPKDLDTEEPEYQVRLVHFQHIMLLQDNITAMLKKNGSRAQLYRWALIIFIVLAAAMAGALPALLGHASGRN